MSVFHRRDICSSNLKQQCLCPSSMHLAHLEEAKWICQPQPQISSFVCQCKFHCQSASGQVQPFFSSNKVITKGIWSLEKKTNHFSLLRVTNQSYCNYRLLCNSDKQQRNILPVNKLVVLGSWILPAAQWYFQMHCNTGYCSFMMAVCTTVLTTNLSTVLWLQQS